MANFSMFREAPMVLLVILFFGAMTSEANVMHTAKCQVGRACHWDEFVQEVDWHYLHDTNGNCTHCEKLCLSYDNCTGYECGGDYCTSWLNGACNQTRVGNNVGVTTCLISGNMTDHPTYVYEPLVPPPKKECNSSYSGCRTYWRQCCPGSTKPDAFNNCGVLDCSDPDKPCEGTWMREFCPHICGLCRKKAPVTTKPAYYYNPPAYYYNDTHQHGQGDDITSPVPVPPTKASLTIQTDTNSAVPVPPTKASLTIQTDTNSAVERVASSGSAPSLMWSMILTTLVFMM